MSLSSSPLYCPSLSPLVTTSLFFGEGNGTPLQYFCLENPVDGGAWGAAVHGVAKSRIRLSNFTFTFHFHALEKEMATHSSILAWRIPGTGSLWGRTESDTTEMMQQQQQFVLCIYESASFLLHSLVCCIFRFYI